MHLSKSVLASLGLAVAVTGAARLQAADVKPSAGQAKQEMTQTMGGGAKIDPQAAENKFRSFYEQVANKQNWDQLNDYVTNDFKEHNPAPGAENVKGPDAVREGFKQIFAAFPDGKFDVDRIVVQGNQAVARYTFTGTQKGAFMNLQPTNKKVKVMGFDWATLDENMKATEHWGFWDTASLMQQLRPKQQARAD